MSLAIAELIEQIHNAPGRVVLVASGGGAQAIADLLAVPGASRTVLEAVVPYSEDAMIAWLRGRPDQFCSSQTARAMAVVALDRARQFAPAETVVAGVAATASLATDRPKRGPHRLHAAVQTLARSEWWSLTLQKQRRTREAEEEIVRRLLLNLVAETCGLAARLDLPLLDGEELQHAEVAAPPAWQDLWAGKVEAVRHGGDESSAAAIFPGAFNPLHEGHRQMLVVAEQELGLPVAMEISIVNPDKPPLDHGEIQQRLAQFRREQAVWLTRAATFEAKSRVFGGVWFVVGIDTLTRLVAPRYYGDDPAACQRALQAIAARGCRFLVFGRDTGRGFVRLADVALPNWMRPLCREVTPAQFRADISSTALRKAGHRDAE